MVDISTDDWLYPVVRTGKRGRPPNTGPRDFHHLYKMAELMAADPALSQAEAARRATGPDDRTAWDRLPRKFRHHPNLLPAARERREKQIQRYLKELKRRRLEVSMLGCKTKARAIGYVRSASLIFADIWADARVAAAEKDFWRVVRPGLVEEMLARYLEVEKLMTIARCFEDIADMQRR